MDALRPTPLPKQKLQHSLMDGPVDVVLDYPSHVLLLAQEELVALKMLLKDVA